MATAQTLGSYSSGLDALLEITASRRVAVLTGAGVSTDSGIPDYRGQGASKRTPMKIDDFLHSHQSRQRYWAGAHVGWKSFSSAEPNAGHIALAAMEQAGIIEGIVSQNVDGLHRRAGSSQVIDLHGSLDRVVCLECSQAYDRSAVESRVSALNPWLDAISDIVLAPDGDVNVTDYERVVVPECTLCGGILKPDVVFFGEFVPLKVYQAATSYVKRADCLLIAGSSLAVNSGLRLIEIARKKRMPIVIINRGDTKGDKYATLKLNAGTSEVLDALAQGLGAHLFEDIE
jgi:NAD-dependent SIR2 family protein deacetylase